MFGDYQGFRQYTPIGVDFATVPTQLMRQGNFSELLNPATSGLSQLYTIRDVATGSPFPGNVIPNNSQNPAGVKYLNAYPLPNISGKVQQNYVTQRTQHQKFDDFDVRGDWTVRDNDRLFARASYAHDKQNTTSRLQACRPASAPASSSRTRKVSPWVTRTPSARCCSQICAWDSSARSSATPLPLRTSRFRRVLGYRMPTTARCSAAEH